MAKAKPTKMLAVLGRCRRTGRWRVAAKSQVLAVLGTCSLDMRRSFVESDDQLKMKVTVVFGSATFLLPHGAEVRPSGVSFLASSLVDVPEHEDESELPTLDIEWICMFGRLRIITEEALMEQVAEPEVEEVEPEPGDVAGAAAGGDDGSATGEPDNADSDDHETEREPVAAAA